MATAFSCDRYLEAQMRAFRERLLQAPEGGRTYIEFGGKAVDDQHATRVLPGYHPDLKLELLKELQGTVSIAIAVTARDILKPRIRGDSQLFYNLETIELIKRLATRGLRVDAGVVTLVEEHYDDEDRGRLDDFFTRAERETGVRFVSHGATANYPHLERPSDWAVWKSEERLNTNGHNVLVLSPGGGSGKFGVCVSELYRDYLQLVNSFYIKFETFPVFDLPPEHPVNRAFVAATADLGNVVLHESGDELTTYDKDYDNFELLMRIHRAHCPDLEKNPISLYEHPSDMGINRLTSGFVNETAISRAARREIIRRKERYKREIALGIETPRTLEHFMRNLPREVSHEH